MRITFVSNEAVGTNQQVLSRTFIDVVDLRNLLDHDKISYTAFDHESS